VFVKPEGYTTKVVLASASPLLCMQSLADIAREEAGRSRSIETGAGDRSRSDQRQRDSQRESVYARRHTFRRAQEGIEGILFHRGADRHPQHPKLIAKA
jgi:hypothetical protein